MAFGRMGEILSHLGKSQQAEAVIRQGLDRSGAIVDAFRSSPGYVNGHSYLLVKLGEILRDTGRFPEAKVAFRKAMEAVSPLADAHPQDPRYQLGLVRISLYLRSSLQSNETEEADELLQRYLPVMEKLVGEHPNDPDCQYLWAQMLKDRAAWLGRKGQIKEQEKTYRQSIEISERLVARYPSEQELQEAAGR